MSPEQPYDGRLDGTAARTDGRELRGTMPLLPRRGPCDRCFMKGWFLRRSTVTSAMRAELVGELAHLGMPITVNESACCCPARPMVTVMMPPTASRPYPVDLLLCGHHYRVSQAALRAAGAVVYDEAGVPITAGISDYQHSRHQPAAASPRP